MISKMEIRDRSRSLFISFTILLAVASLVPGVKLIDPEIEAKIDDFVRNVFMPANLDPALSIAVSVNGSLIYSTGYGFMDVENQLPATNLTLYPIGSVSKSIAAVIVVKTLHEKFPELGGKVLDTPIQKLIPGFNFTLNDRYRSEQTSFRDMLSHRVCSRADGIASLIVPFKNSAEMAYRQRYAEEECNFRTGLVYNNGMYALISETIGAIAGQTYQTLLEGLLRDLGMHDSTYVKESDQDVMPGRAIPYYWLDGARHRYNPKLVKRVVIATAAGGVVSNAVDMAKYVQFHLDKGKVGDQQIVPENVMNWLYEIAIHLPASEAQAPTSEVVIGYAMGLDRAVSDGWHKISHGGIVPPYQSEIDFFPGLNMGIYSVTNQWLVNWNIGHAQLHAAIFKILRGENVTTVDDLSLQTSRNEKCSQNQKEKASIRNKILSPEVQQDFLGPYGSGLQGELNIILKHREETNSSELYMDYGEWGQAYLLGTQNDLEFQFIWDSDMIQDSYGFGEDISDIFGVFDESKTTFQVVENGASWGVFTRGVNLDILPAIPWSPDSCGPENETK